MTSARGHPASPVPAPGTRRVVATGPSPLGAYGLCLPALEGAERWMQPQPAGTPTLHLQVEVGPADEGPSRVDERSADLRLLGGGRLRARKGDGTVHFVFDTVPPPEDLLHPYLAPAAALVWRWAGREVIHAGAVSFPRGAVLLLGGKKAGKSTTLAWLAQTATVGVLADDLAVVDGNLVLAGPRSIDLRAPLPAQASPLTPVREACRARLTLPPAPDSVPLAGVAVLDWGPALEVSPIPLDRRWAAIAAQRMFPGLAGNAESLLEVLAAPAYRFARPPGPAGLEQVGRAILDNFS